MKDYEAAFVAALETVTHDPQAIALGKQSFAREVDDPDWFADAAETALKEAVPGIGTQQRLAALTVFMQVANGEPGRHEQLPVPDAPQPAAAATTPPAVEESAAPTTPAPQGPPSSPVTSEPAPKPATGDNQADATPAPPKPESAVDRAKRWWDNLKTNLN